MTTSCRRASALLCALVALLFARGAHAEADFPDTIVAHYAIACANPKFDGSGCTICHRDNGGQCGTVNKPFGIYLESQGLTCATLDPKLLEKLLDDAADAGVDTNCDGIPDVEELRTCRWQELAQPRACDAGDGTVIEPAPEVVYGCALAPHADVSAFGLAACVAAFLMFCRRRAR